MMTKAIAILALVSLVLALAPAAAQPAYPQAEITNGRIRAVLHLPDPQAGYYRATRFDWSGSIASAEWKGHTYFGQWFPRHDPKINDAITGPVEEFDNIGYDEAKPGESFVRLGIGAIRKPDEPAYRRFSTYEIADPGKWTVNKSADAIEFVHELGDTLGYAYVYRKKVRLDGNSIVLEHRLQNTGRKAIATNGYNHDFFMLDNQPTGPDFVVKFAFEPKAVSPQAIAGFVELRGKEWVYLQELQRSVQTQITGFGPTARDNDFRVENHKTGAAVRQTGDRPLTKINVWSPRTTICPEAFIDVRVDPGKETTWRINYEFYEVAKR
jgi:hypothetical protein